MHNANRTKTDNHIDVSSRRLAEFLKRTIEALPGSQFTQAWQCIEEINAAMNKAGPTAPLAAAYCRAVRAERTAELAEVV